MQGPTAPDSPVPEEREQKPVEKRAFASSVGHRDPRGSGEVGMVKPSASKFVELSLGKLILMT